MELDDEPLVLGFPTPFVTPFEWEFEFALLLYERQEYPLTDLDTFKYEGGLCSGVVGEPFCC